MSEEFLRKVDHASGVMTETEAEKWNEGVAAWKNTILRTRPMDRNKVMKSVNALYEAAGQKKPVVVFADGPMSMALAGAFVSAMLYAKEHTAFQGLARKTWQGKGEVEKGTLRLVDLLATHLGLYSNKSSTGINKKEDFSKVQEALDKKVAEEILLKSRRNAVSQTVTAIQPELDSKVREPIKDKLLTIARNSEHLDTALNNEVYGAGRINLESLAKELTDDDALASLMVGCAKTWNVLKQQGSFEGHHECYLTLARDVLGLQLEAHPRYEHWSDLAQESFYRFVHKDFCIVSDFPTTHKLDDQNRFHCEDGPSIAFADGFVAYHWHGLKMPYEVYEQPEAFTVARIDREQNGEIRRALTEKYGWGKYLIDAGAEVIDQYTDQKGHPVKLYRKHVGTVGFTEDYVHMLEMTNSTLEGLHDREGNFTPDMSKGAPYHKKYMFCVPPSIMTAKQAHAWHCGYNVDEADEIQFVEQT